MAKPGKGNRRYTRDILPPPHSLVTNGKVHFGTFNGPFRVVNPLDATRAFWFPLPRFIKNFRLKEWQAFQLGNDECFILVVIYNQKVGCLIQFIFCDKKTRQMIKYEKKVPSWHARVPSSLGDTRAHYIAKGFQIDIHNKLDQGKIFIDVAIDAIDNQPAVYGHFEMFHETGAVKPLVVSLPLGDNRGMYSHKCLMPMEGVLFIGDRSIEFKRRSGFAILDDHKGYYPYVLRYDWVTGAGVSAKGLTGFNLTDNQVRDKERYNENCIWAGNELHLLPPVTVARPNGVYDDWIIQDEYGMVDLIFTPLIENVIKLNLLAIKTDYYGPFGCFSGSIELSSGKRISVDDYFGMGEKKYFRG